MILKFRWDTSSFLQSFTNCFLISLQCFFHFIRIPAIKIRLLWFILRKELAEIRTKKILSDKVAQAKLMWIEKLLKNYLIPCFIMLRNNTQLMCSI